jgi:uncharacterized protein
MLQIEVIRLTPGDDLRAALEARGFAAACVLSAVGSFTQAVLRYAQQPDGTTLAGPLELLSLAGTLGLDGGHLHASVADAQGQVRGGHVMRGCIVRTTAEVVVALLPGWEFRRALDAATGYKELVARKQGEGTP